MSYFTDTSIEFEDDFSFEELSIRSTPEVDALLSGAHCSECLDDIEWLLTGIAEVSGSTSTDFSVGEIYLRGDDLKLRRVENIDLWKVLRKRLDLQFRDRIMLEGETGYFPRISFVQCNEVVL